jgi:biopolymer transport protein TolQ
MSRAIIFYKVSVIQRAIKESDRFLDFFWTKKRFDIVGQGIKEFSHSPIANLFREGYHEMLQLKKKSADPTEPGDFSLLLKKSSEALSKDIKPFSVILKSSF